MTDGCQDVKIAMLRLEPLHELAMTMTNGDPTGVAPAHRSAANAGLRPDRCCAAGGTARRRRCGRPASSRYGSRCRSARVAGPPRPRCPATKPRPAPSLPWRTRPSPPARLPGPSGHGRRSNATRLGARRRACGSMPQAGHGRVVPASACCPKDPHGFVLTVERQARLPPSG